MERATTRSKAATAMQKWSHATSRICWPCTPLRRPPDERAAGWEAADHLTVVANITRHQIRRLWDIGISTVRALAALPVSSRVPGIQPNTFDRLRHQATLQIAKR